MPRLHLLAVVVLAAAALAHGFQIEEATIDAIQLGFKNDSLTSTALVRLYLDRNSRLNPLLRAVIEVNLDALRQAARAERCSSSFSRRRSCQTLTTSALHGVPVLLKDNIATCDGRLSTTAGSLGD